jgi:hypothetical protein
MTSLHAARAAKRNRALLKSVVAFRAAQPIQPCLNLSKVPISHEEFYCRERLAVIERDAENHRGELRILRETLDKIGSRRECGRKFA